MKAHHFFSAIAVALMALTAYAHGDAAHAKKPAQTISPEEKPFGRQGDPKKVTRTIVVNMTDAMRFTPAEITVKQGETIKFVIGNSGKLMHELVLGTMKELKEHGEMMKQHPGMEHDEPYMAHVAPSHKGELVWQFTQAGEFHYACLVPGHFEAGMVGKITVAANSGGGQTVSSTDTAKPADESTAMSEGEIRKIDKAAGKITIRHGELKNLGMPPMTMVFKVKDAALLDRVKVGDRISFIAEKIDGAFTVTEVATAK